MRSLIATSAIAAVLFTAAAAHAERRIFITANDGDGYGVDRCLSSGGACGAAVANTYCHAHEFNQALSFHKVDRDDITGAIPTSGPGSCKSGGCDEFVAIECTR
jgi:hypothetical protein